MHNDTPVKDIPRVAAAETVSQSVAPATTGNYRCLLSCDAQVKFADDEFRTSIAQRGLLIFADGCLLPALADHRQVWLDTLNEVNQTGQGQFFALTMLPKLESIGIVPDAQAGLISIRLPQPRLCSPESVMGYARLVRLTPRETSVLDLVTQGLTPTAVAATLQTRESTVRTQIKSILAKSNHHSMRGLLVTLACLPTMARAAPALQRTPEQTAIRPALSSDDGLVAMSSSVY